MWLTNRVRGNDIGRWGTSAYRSLMGHRHLVATGQRQRLIYKCAPTLVRTCRDRFALSESNSKNQGGDKDGGCRSPPSAGPPWSGCGDPLRRHRAVHDASLPLACVVRHRLRVKAATLSRARRRRCQIADGGSTSGMKVIGRCQRSGTHFAEVGR